MKIQKKELIKVLEMAKPGLSTKDVIENTNSFYFSGTEIITFNDEICTRVPYETDFVGTVNAEKFYSILNKMQDNISLSFTDDEIILSSGKAKVGMPLNTEGELPIDELGELPPFKKFKLLPKTFLDGIQLSSFCVSSDTSNPILSCLYIKNKIMSSDSYKIFLYELDKNMPSFLLPAFNVNSITKYKLSKYHLNNNWIHFTGDDGFVISVRVYPSDEYPDVIGLFDDVQGKKLTFPDKMKEILDKAVIFCDGAFDIDTVVNIQITGKKLTVSSKSDSGWFKESVIIKGNKLNIQFDLNPNFLKQIFKLGSSCVIDTTDKKMFFEGDNWKYLFSVDVK